MLHTLRVMFERFGTVLLAALSLAVVSLGAGCRPREARAARARPPPLVVVSRVEARDVRVEVRAPVDLRPLSSVDVGSRTLGYLAEVRVDRGDRVRRGDLLAVVRPSDLPDQFNAAQAALGQNRAQLELSRATLERLRALAPTGAVSQQELAVAQAAVARGEAERAAMTAQAAAVGTRLRETRITSPIEGVVTQRRLDPGALVGPGTGATGTILTVARADTLRAFVPVNEREAPSVNVGQPAEITVDALPGRVFAGTVARLAPTFDPITRTLDAEVQLSNTEGLLRPGMYGRGALVTAVHRGAPVVPAASLQVRGEARFVFVLAGDRVQRRRVETGTDGGDWLEVTRGLTPGESIVTAGFDTLSDDARVRVARDVDPYTGSRRGGARPDGGR